MRKQLDLLNGPIASTLAKLAFPIMGTSLIQMAYNLVDMIWIGRISSNAVAAIGAAGMYMWLAQGFTTIPRMGGQVTVGHALGAGETDNAIDYTRAALRIGIFIGTIYALISVIFSGPLIGFFKLNSPAVISDAKKYLIITCGAILFSFLNQILTGILAAMGNTMVTFRATTIGLVINLVLDPILIFGVGPLPAMKVVGAALATVFAQVVVFVIYVITVWDEPIIFQHLHITRKAEKQHVEAIIKIGVPSAVQETLFSGISMIIARLIAGWGDAAVAVQKIGSQIESISWMTASGFATAVNAFVAQNYGAKKPDRIKNGYKTAMLIMILWGIFTSFLLLVFPEFFFRIFITEEEVIPMGVAYLRIIGISEIFMCMEITSSGAFQGMGKTVPPSVSGVLFNAIRIPLAMFLSSTVLELNGVWWALTISSILKGITIPTWFILVFIKYYKAAKK